MRRIRVILSAVAALCVLCALAVPPAHSKPPRETTGPMTPATTLGWNIWDSAALDSTERSLGLRAGVVGIFADFVNNPLFPLEMVEHIARRGAIPMFAWEPWDSHRNTAVQPRWQLRDLISGRHDRLIRRWARAAAAWGGRLLLRFAPEMNGDWRPWSPGVNGNTVDQYSAAWRHTRRMFLAQGATNVEWVWNPYVSAGESTAMQEVYPGSKHVDWVGLDGHNWGSTRSPGWQTYEDIFAPTVDTIRALAPDKPWMIAEVGCAPGPGKAQWIRDTLTAAHNDGASAVVWFEFDKETDWRLTESEATITAVREIAGGSGWVTALP